MIYVIRHAHKEELDYLVSMGKRMHEVSLFKHMDYNDDKVRDLLVAALNGAPRLFLMVIVHTPTEVPVGVLVAILADTFFGNDHVASDMVMIVEPEHRGDCKDALRSMTSAYRRWATAYGAKRIYLSTSTGIDPERTAKAYEYCGFHSIGSVHESVGE